MLALEGASTGARVCEQSVLDWNSDSFEKSMFSLMLAITVIQQHVEIPDLQTQASRGRESKWAYAFLIQVGGSILGITSV